MSTRTRTRSRASGQSYTARLQQRSAASRRTRPLPSWLTRPHTPALVALAAELGHLAAALIEWPAATPRGLLHVLAATALGLVAVGVYFGPNRMVLVAGIGMGVALPLGWVVAAAAGVPLYRDCPLWLGLVVTTLEVTLAAMLVVLWLTPAPTPPPRRPRTPPGTAGSTRSSMSR